jgi:hypothetical protein
MNIEYLTFDFHGILRFPDSYHKTCQLIQTQQIKLHHPTLLLKPKFSNKARHVSEAKKS